jgi:hypothetical protein
MGCGVFPLQGTVAIPLSVPAAPSPPLVVPYWWRAIRECHQLLTSKNVDDSKNDDWQGQRYSENISHDPDLYGLTCPDSGYHRMGGF